MDPIAFAMLAGLGSFTAALIWWVLKHLQSDIDYARDTSNRAVETAEEATSVAEKRV